MTRIESAREAFLSMLADASVFEEQPDADMNDVGKLIDCTTFKLIVGHSQFEGLCDALGIERNRYDEPLIDALTRYIQTPAAA